MAFPTLGTSFAKIIDATPLNGTMTFTSNANRGLVIMAGAHQATIGTVTLNGTTLTQLALGTTQFNENICLYYYNAPPSGGQGTIIVTATGGNGVALIAAEFDGVKQTGQPSVTAVSSLGNNGTALGTLTTLSANNVIVGGFYSEANLSTDSQTTIGTLQAQSFENMVASYADQASAAAGTFSWTLAFGARWAVVMASLEPAAAATSYTAHNLSLLGVGS